MQRFSYIMIYDPDRKLYVEIDASFEHGFGAVAYMVSGDHEPAYLGGWQSFPLHSQHYLADLVP